MESALDTFRRFRRIFPKSGRVKSDPDRESLPWLEDVLCGDRMSFVQGDGGTELALWGSSTGRLNPPEVWWVPLQTSISDPELISAETLLRSRAKVTFFSSLGSGMMTVVGVEAVELVSKKAVSLSSKDGSIWSGGFRWLSDMWISSPRLNLGRIWDALGEINCWRICFFSAAFFLVGVELFRFFRGEGVPIGINWLR